MENILSPQKLISEVKNNLGILKKEQSFLFENDIHEISIVHKIACLLEKNPFLSHYSIDLEYNRITNFNKGEEIKKTFQSDSKDLFRPDLIVHLPNTQLANLLVIEFAKGGDTSREQSKLAEMTKGDGKYRYRLGVLVNFSKGYKGDNWEYFVDGQATNYKDAIRTLEKYNNDSLSVQFQKVADIYWTNKPDQSNHEIINLELLQELHNFGDEIKKYLSHIYVPDYQWLSEMIDFLYKDVLPAINSSIYSSELHDIGWLNQWVDVLPAISKLLLYCHYSIVENNSPKISLILSGLINISESFSDENILNRFENSFFGQ